MPADYGQGKIYRITCALNDIIYIGSTTMRLSQREKKHLSCVRNLTMTSPFYTSIRALGAANFQIGLVKNFPCQTKAELETEEYRVMDDLAAMGQQLYNEKRNGKHSQATRAKMAQSKIGNRNALKLGSLFFNRKAKSWQFFWMNQGKQCGKSFATGKYGFWGAKDLAESQRRLIFPQWEKDAEEEACEALLRMEV